MPWIVGFSDGTEGEVDGDDRAEDALSEEQGKYRCENRVLANKTECV